MDKVFQALCCLCGGGGGGKKIDCFITYSPPATKRYRMDRERIVGEGLV